MVPMPLPQWGIVLGLAVTPLVVCEIEKAVRRARTGRPGPCGEGGGGLSLKGKKHERHPLDQADGSKGVFFWLNALYATLRRRLVGKGNGQIPQMETGDGIQRKDGLEGAGEGVDAALGETAQVNGVLLDVLGGPIGEGNVEREVAEPFPLLLLQPRLFGQFGGAGS